MKNECGKLHIPNYSVSCCLRHLLEMAKYAEMQTQIKKYSKLLLITLNHSYRENSLNIQSMKLDLVLLLLDVLSNYISHFFLINKFEYSKLLCIIAIKAIRETVYKTNPEIILRENAINNNIACLYESKGKYNKAYKYISYNKKYIGTSSHIDNAILFNNLIRIALKANKTNDINEYIEQMKNCLVIEMKRSKEAMMKQTSNNNIYEANSFLTEKNILISFLMYNLGNILEKVSQNNKSKEIFIKGYEFSMSTIGEHHFYTNKYLTKITASISKNFIEDLNENRYQYKYKEISSEESENENKLMLQSGSKIYSSDEKLTDDLLDKINVIYDYVVSQKGFCNSEQKHSASETEPSVSVKNEKKRPSTYEKFKQLLKPIIQKIINEHEGEHKKKSAHDLISEVLEEFQTEKNNNKNEDSNKEKKRNANKTPKIKSVFERVLGKTLGERKPKKEGTLSMMIGDLYKMKFEEKVNDSSQPSTTISKAPLQDLIEPTNNNSNVILTPRNFLKPELEQISKGITFNISKEENNEQDEFEMKPFYKVNEAYKNVVSKLKNINQKTVKFIKTKKNNENSLFNLHELLKKANEKDEDPICVVAPPSERKYEFVPFYVKNPEASNTPNSSVKEEKVTKFMKGSFHDPNSNDLLSGIQNRSKNSNRSNESNNDNDYDMELKVNNISDNEIILNTISESSEDENLFDINHLFDTYKKWSKNKQKYDIGKIFNEVSKTASEITKPILVMVPFQDKMYRIVIESKTNKIYFSLYLSQEINGNSISTLSIDYTKMKNIVEKLYLFNSLPSFYDINQIKTFSQLIELILVYHLTIIKKGEKLSIGLSAKSNGICGDKQITFKFLKQSCTINLLCLNSQNIFRILISNAKASNLSISIDCYCDKNSFSEIVSEVDSNIAMKEKVKILPTYKFNETHIGKNGIVPVLMRKIQEIIKEKIGIKLGKENFVDVYSELEDSKWFCEIGNNCKKVKIFFFYKNEKFDYDL